MHQQNHCIVLVEPRKKLAAVKYCQIMSNIGFLSDRANCCTKFCSREQIEKSHNLHFSSQLGNLKLLSIWSLSCSKHLLRILKVGRGWKGKNWNTKKMWNWSSDICKKGNFFKLPDERFLFLLQSVLFLYLCQIKNKLCPVWVFNLLCYFTASEANFVLKGKLYTRLLHSQEKQSGCTNTI